jgi:hypothetical protein
MSKLIILLVFLTIACNTNRPIDLRQRVKDFDLKNGETVQMICDSLIESTAKNNNFFLAIPRDGQEPYFRQIDSPTTLGHRFEPSYQLSVRQVEFFRNIGINTLYYHRDQQKFFIYLRDYSSGDSSVIMYLHYGSQKLSFKKSPLFSARNRVYILAKTNLE